MTPDTTITEDALIPPDANDPPESKPDDFIETELQKFNVTDAVIAQMRANYLTIKVVDYTDKANAALARSRRLEVKGLRVEAEKVRVALKADSLKFGKAVDAKAKSIIKPLEEIEAYLQEQEDIVAKHAEREAAKERERIAREQEAERQRLEAERRKLEEEKAEIERQKQELEQAQKANAERATISEIAATQGYAEAKRSTIQAAGPLKIRVYYHASKECLIEKGQTAGLTDEALKLFMFAGEIGVDLFVNPETGEVVNSILAG